MKHVDFIHLHNHSQFSPLEWATRMVSIVAVAIAGLMGTAIGSPWEDSFRSARVIREFDTGGLPIAAVWVAENTVVAGLKDGDSARIIVVWDTTGRELFRVSRRDTSLPVDNGHSLRLYLSDVSADGSTFALFQAWKTTLYDRSGDTLASFWSEPQGRLSPNGHYWMPGHGSVEDYQCDFQLRARSGELLDESVSDGEGYWSGAFMSDGQILAYWTRRGISMDLPSREIQSRIVRPEEFSDGNLFSVVKSNTGRFAVLRGGREIVQIVDSLGTHIRDVGCRNAWDVSFGPMDSVVGLLDYGGRAGRRVILACLSDSSRDVWTEQLGEQMIYATSLEFLPSTDLNQMSVLLRSKARLISNVVTIDLRTGEVTDIFELPDEHIVMPGRSGRLIRLSGECDKEHVNSCLATSYSTIELIELGR